MKSKLIFTIATLAALALPAIAAENNFRDRDRDRGNVAVRSDDTYLRRPDFDELQRLYGDRYRNHSILVDRDRLDHLERLRRERFDRDRDRDDVRR